jgi:putative copper export protein
MFALTGVSQHALGVPWRQFPASPQATGIFLALLAVGFTAYVARDAPFAVAPLALVGLLPPLLTGHVRTAPVPWLAGTSMVLHVVAAALWVGGLLAVGYLATGAVRSWRDAARRFSPLALGAAMTVAASGVLLALSRVGSVGDLLGSAYGLVVVAKVIALAVLVTVGHRQRSTVLDAHGAPRSTFVRLAGTEVVVMALTFALAAGLSQTPPP